VANILETIVEEKNAKLRCCPRGSSPPAILRDALLERDERRDFVTALQHPCHGDIALIAEVKKASPSAGVYLQGL